MELRIFAEPQEGASYEQQLSMALAAESHGFGAFFRSDHLLRIKPGSGAPGPTDSWVTLGALARETSTIRLGTMVTSATFRLPGPLAVAVAQVDAMSGGRVEFGLGSGWFEAEHAAYGIPFPVDRRSASIAWRSSCAILTGMWSTPEGESYSFQGPTTASLTGRRCPSRLQRPDPPVIVGGLGARRTPALAARFANEFNVPFAPADLTAAAVSRACARPARRWSRPRRADLLARDHRLLRQRALRAAAARCSHRPRFEDLRRAGAAGSPARGDRPGLEEYQRAGASRSYLQVIDLDDLDHVALIAAEVMAWT